MKTLAVFFGGDSNEHEISVITGMFVANLLRERYRVVPVYLALGGGMYSHEEMRGISDFENFSPKRFPEVALEEGKLVLKRKRKKVLALLDAALNCCHGGAGEDGTLAALLRLNRIPFASPDTAVSAVFMDKDLGKIAARGLGIPVVESFCVREREWLASPDTVIERAEAFGFPVIVKPVKLGSSIGIKVAKNEAELRDALSLAFRLDSGALVERYLEHKRDINCAAYCKGGETVLSECEEVFSEEAILSFSEKYEGTGARNSMLPAQIPEELSEGIKDATRRIYESFSVRGVVRADFLISGNKFYFNELNTVPGSLACYLFGESLIDARDFLVSLVEEAKPECGRERVHTGILSSPVFSGAKGCKRR